MFGFLFRNIDKCVFKEKSRHVALTTLLYKEGLKIDLFISTKRFNLQSLRKWKPFWFKCSHALIMILKNLRIVMTSYKNRHIHIHISPVFIFFLLHVHKIRRDLFYLLDYVTRLSEKLKFILKKWFRDKLAIIFQI